MSTNVIVADFTTQLSVAIAAGGTTGTLYSNTDDDGVSLPTGLYYFTIDGGNSLKEHICCTNTAGVLTAIKSVSRQGAETSGAARAHRVGASVVMTDFATYKHYIDNVVVQGSVDASDSVKGVTKLSVAPASSVNPIAVGDNDPRMITTAEHTTVTALTTSVGGTIYGADSVGTDAYAVTLSPAVTSLTAGLKVIFKAGTANTGAATLAVNGLAAKAIKKNYNSDVVTGDILAGQIVEVVYDLANTTWQMVSPITPAALPLKIGNTTHDVSVTGTQTIAHGLGKIPSYIKIYASTSITNGYLGASASYGVFDGTNTITNYFYVGSVNSGTTNFPMGGASVDTSKIINLAPNNATGITASVAFDSTNITLTWANTNSPTGTASILWEAYY